MTSTLGLIEPFDTSTPAKWDSYVARFKFFLDANTVAGEKRRLAVFFSVCGADTFELLESLVAPATPESKTLDEVFEVLKAHFSPQPSEIVRRNTFYKRNQAPEETVSFYIAELRRLAQHCNFPNLEEMLRDRLVCGLRDEHLQNRLFAKKQLTFAVAQEEALEAEAAAKSTRVVRQSEENDSAATVAATNQVKRQEPAALEQTDRPATSNGTCYGCGGAHLRADCRFKNAQCRACKKTGHIERVCRSGGSSGQQRNLPPRQPRNSKAAYNVTALPHDECYYNNHVGAEGSQVSRKLRATVAIEGQTCEMEVDSGSDFSILTEETFRRLQQCNGELALTDFSSTVVDYQLSPVDVMGSCNVHVEYKEFAGPLTVSPRSKKLTVDSVLSEFSEVFEEGLGNYVGPPVSLHLDPNIQPVRLKARRLPFAIQPKVEEELDRLVQQGVLEPVTQPMWETPIVTVLKSNGDVRICGDYKSTINKALKQHPYPIPVELRRHVDQMRRRHVDSELAEQPQASNSARPKDSRIDTDQTGSRSSSRHVRRPAYLNDFI
ncbi:hypothetical protein MTO96_043361 [Rhipicephalus appendiculatus]